MASMTAAGTSFYISATLPTTHDATGFAALTYTLVGEVTDGGSGMGRVYNEVTHSPLSNREVQIRKGSYRSGSLDLQMALDDDDAGQVMLNQALISDNNYAFKVSYQNGAIRYFKAQTMSFAENIGTIDNIVTAAATLAINDGGVVKVPAP